MKYKIEIGYHTELTYEDFEDFTSALGVLFNGGVRDELRVKAQADEEPEEV